MTEQTKTIQEINDQLSKAEKEFIDQQKKELAATISDTYKNWKKDVKGMNQAFFAEFIGTSQPRVSNIISGKVDNFTVDKLLCFCVRLNIKAQLQSKPLKNMKQETRAIVEELKRLHAA